MEKVEYDAISAEDPANPSESFKAGMIPQSCPQLGDGAGPLDPTLSSHWIWAPLGMGHAG